eukprot:Skav229297  [mRNA]  locus=scaffold544:180827:182687:+ [translate_table: standard]
MVSTQRATWVSVPHGVQVAFQVLGTWQAQEIVAAQVGPPTRNFHAFMAPTVTELMDHLHRAVKDEDVEVLKRDLGLSEQEISDMMKIVAKDNQRSECLFAQVRCLLAPVGILFAIVSYMSSQGSFNSAYFTLLGFAILFLSLGIGICVLSFLFLCREENHYSVARKLNRRFPQLHCTISTILKEDRTGWRLVVKKRDGKTATEEETVSKHRSLLELHTAPVLRRN